VLIAHGAGTEKRFLRAFPLHGFGPWVDTVALSRRFLPSLSDHALGSVCAALELTDEVARLVPDGRWHHALFDAVASLLVVRRLVSELKLEHHDVVDLIHW